MRCYVFICKNINFVCTLTRGDELKRVKFNIRPGEIMSTPKYYEPLDGEPPEWFDKFNKFVLMAESDNVLKAYTAWRIDEYGRKLAQWKASKAKKKPKQPQPPPGRLSVPKGWQRAAEKYEWFDRRSVYLVDRREAHDRMVMDTVSAELKELVPTSMRAITRFIQEASRVDLDEARPVDLVRSASLMLPVFEYLLDSSGLASALQNQDHIDPIANALSDDSEQANHAVIELAELNKRRAERVKQNASK